ncbi:MAG: putative ABC transport system permease protein [Oceanicoccus sp.]
MEKPVLLAKLAFRNIFRQRRRSLLTGLSMGGGYVLLALTLSLVEGSYNNLIDIFTHDHTGHVQIHKGDYVDRPGIQKTLSINSGIEQILDNEDQVISWAPRVFGVGLGYGSSKSAPLSIVGIDPSLEKNTTKIFEKIHQGEYFNNKINGEGYFSAMIGYGVADMLKLSIGDEIVLISSGVDGSIANDIYIVKALVGNKASYDKMNVYLPLNAAQDFFSMQGKVHEYAVITSRSTEARELAQTIALSINNSEISVSPWQEVEATFYKSMEADKQGNKVTMGIVVFLICIGVLNTVLMSVLERTREFGVMLAVGTNRFTVMSMIILETSALGLLSCLGGFIVSIPLIYWFTNVGITMPQAMDLGGIIYDTMKGEMNVLVFTLPAAIIVGSAALVSLLPGIRAAHITPLDALSDR